MEKVFGSGSGAVVDLINKRLQSQGNTFEDGRRLGLVVEGGGMRGVLSAGSLFALYLMGGANVFDEIYAVSAGGVNAAYFLSGQGEMGISVYFDDVSSLRFANPWRFWKIIDVDWVYDHIVPNVKRLDEQRIKSGRPDLFLGLTDVETGMATLVDVKHQPDSIAQILKASSAMPILYNRTISIGGRRYVDGGLTDNLPVAAAASRGCTDILVLATKSDAHVSNAPPLWERAIFHAMMGMRHPEAGRAHATNFQRSSESRAYAFGLKSIEGVNIATICPNAQEQKIVGRLTRDRGTLLNAARQMADKTARVLNRPVVSIDEAFERLSTARTPEEMQTSS